MTIRSCCLLALLPILPLRVERLPDLNVPRAGHQTFYVNNEMVAVGGHTSGFVPTPTAEYFRDGQWHLMNTVYKHDQGFALPLKSGKVMSFDKTKTDERGVIWYHVKGGWISSKNTTQIEGSVDKEKKSSGRTVKATGDMHLRKGPGLDYAEVKVIKAGKTAKYLGSTKKDSRGVAWYKVSFNNKTGWVSSKYGKLIK